MIGKAIKYDIKDINTDLIIPARYLTNSDSDYLTKHCMEDLDAKFMEKITKYHYSILITGANFGCGSSREQAPIAIKATGIKCIIALSYARIFFRNAINIGLPIIEFANVDEINTEDELDIHSEKGIIRNLTTKNEFKIKKMPSFILEIISADGLVNFARNKILKKG